jgi:hypothetical protein
MTCLFNKIEKFKKSDNIISFTIEYDIYATTKDCEFYIILDNNELVIRCYYEDEIYRNIFTNSHFICRYFGEEKDKIENIPEYIFDNLDKDNIIKHITLIQFGLFNDLYFGIDMYNFIDNNCLLNIKLNETRITYVS